ncbi:MAG: Fur family transcriptional regulator [Gemmatimonadota bacterium]
MANLSRAEGEALLERFRRHLRDHRQPVTRQRELLAEIVLYSGEHLSADAIIRRLEEKGHRVGTATVYRTLDLLVQSGVARAHDFGEGFRRYEPTRGQSDHEHLICARCGKVEEFTNERLERMLPVIADEHHFQHQRHRVEVFGLCQSCQSLDLGELG